METRTRPGWSPVEIADVEFAAEQLEGTDIGTRLAVIARRMKPTENVHTTQEILTVGDLRGEMSGLDDGCPVGLCIDRGGPETEDFGHNISVEADNNGDGAYLTIIAKTN